MSTMVLAVSAEVGGSTPSAQGAACGAAGARRWRRCDAKERGVDDDVDDEVEGVEIIDGASRNAAAGAALGSTVAGLLEAAAADADGTRALSWAAREAMVAGTEGKKRK